IALWVVGNQRLAWRSVGGAALATIGLGLWLAASDWQLADVYRQTATRLATQYRAVAPGEPPTPAGWFLGHLGRAWYAERAGMSQYDRVRSDLRAGDIVIVPSNVHTQPLRPGHRDRLRRLDELTVESTAWGGMRTVWIDLPPIIGGYYSTFSLPWGWSR